MSKLSTLGLQVYALSNRLRITHSYKSSFQAQGTLLWAQLLGSCCLQPRGPSCQLWDCCCGPQLSGSFCDHDGELPWQWTGKARELCRTQYTFSTKQRDLLPQTPASTFSAKWEGSSFVLCTQRYYLSTYRPSWNSPWIQPLGQKPVDVLLYWA